MFQKIKQICRSGLPDSLWSIVETQRETATSHCPPPSKNMERTLDFSGVTSYDFSLSGSDMLLELTQQDVITKIKVEIQKTGQTIKTFVGPPVEKKRGRPAKMTAEQVREIRSEWEKNVNIFGTKSAAAEHLAKIYGCSSKNIYAIIYRYSWNHVEA